MTFVSTDLDLHRAAQYLSSFGIQYLKKEEDDSQTNSCWNRAEASLTTRPTQDGQTLSLFFDGLRLMWTHKEARYSLELIGRSHGEVCIWLHHIALRCGLEGYDFYLHYTLDSGKLRPEQIFDEFDTDRATLLASKRNFAQDICELIRDHYELETEIRVWPHHFDTGGYGLIPNTDLHIGFGMAVPDTVSNDYYFYVSGYRDGRTLHPERAEKMEHGEWRSEGFNGAILTVNSDKRDETILFFKEAIKQLESI